MNDTVPFTFWVKHEIKKFASPVIRSCNPLFFQGVVAVTWKVKGGTVHESAAFDPVDDAAKIYAGLDKFCKCSFCHVAQSNTSFGDDDPSNSQSIFLHLNVSSPVVSTLRFILCMSAVQIYQANKKCSISLSLSHVQIIHDAVIKLFRLHLFLFTSVVDDEAVIDILPRRTKAQRLAIAEAYRTKYGKVGQTHPSYNSRYT